jgi:hypothetical protein
MGKYDYAPRTVHLAGPAILALGMGACAVASTTVHLKHDNIYNMVACAAGSLLLSNLLYAGLTTLQWACVTVGGLCARGGAHDKAGMGSTPRPRPLTDVRVDPDDDDDDARSGRNSELYASVTSHFTATRLLTQTIDFGHRDPEIKLYVSREEVWRMLYPLALGFFVLFVCVPVYDATCTVCLSLGFFAQSTHAELRRGIFFKRPTTRKVFFCGVVLFGLLAHSLVFVFVYIAGVHATREGWASGRGFVDDLTQFHALLYNATASYIHQSHPDGLHAADNATLAGLLLDSPAGVAAAARAADDASVSQYLTWSVNAYPQRMWLLWVLCVCAAPLLRNAPTTVRLPVVLEVTQPAVSAVALLALCLVSWALDVSVFALLDTQSALGDLYLLTSGGSVWFCVFMLCLAVRERCSVHVPCVLVLIAFGKSLVQHSALLRGKQVNELVVCTAVMLALYLGSALYFCRKENVAVRAGWGRVMDSGGGMDSDDELEMDLKLDDTRDSVFAIDEVLDDAMQSISESDEVLEHRPPPAAPAAPPPGPELLPPVPRT